MNAGLLPVNVIARTGGRFALYSCRVITPQKLPSPGSGDLESMYCARAQAGAVGSPTKGHRIVIVNRYCQVFGRFAAGRRPRRPPSVVRDDSQNDWNGDQTKYPDDCAHQATPSVCNNDVM